VTAVWAWVEDDPEILGDAADLAERLDLPAVAFAAGADPQRLADAGAERVYVGEQPYAAESHAEALARCFEEPPRAVLLPGSANGSDLAPRLAARLAAACLMDCAAIVPDGDGLSVVRWAFDDRAQECWHVPPGLPLVATVRPGSRGAPRRRPRPLRLLPPPVAGTGQGEGRAGARPGARRLRALPADPRSVRLAEAPRIVAAGLGIGSRGALGQIEELADLLGASPGVSRPLADRGWAPFERQIGVTGQVVSPDLYVAVGISGAVQHTAGIRAARTLVALNLDASCPMMARADLAVVGDAAEVVPALLRALRERRPRP
jgi:electron transfer flavoprotein alpha subunit